MTTNQPPEPQRHSTDNSIPSVNAMHPAHFAYISDLHFNSLPYLFECLDACNAEMRDHVLFLPYMMIIRPQKRPPATGQETPRELWGDEVSYAAFRRKCEQIVDSGALDGMALTLLIVNTALQYAFGAGSLVTVDQKIAESRQRIEFIKTHGDVLLEQGLSKAAQHAMIRLQEKGIRGLPERTREAYAEYVTFCERVVARLLEERLENALGAG